MAAFSKPGPLFFSFADPVGFSGQKAATELVIGGLSSRGWVCRRLPLPVLKDSGKVTGRAHFVSGLFTAWFRALALLISRGGWLCVNMGQTRFSFLRDAVPLIVGRVGLGRDRVCVTLHGSLFMLWTKDSLDARAFGFLLRNAGVVTVLGETHRARLAALGIAEDRIRIVVNSCDTEVLTAAAVKAKHDPKGAGVRPLRILFLSSLIDTKGYPEFLEAVRRLSAWGGCAIDVVLCGCVAPSEYSERFKDPADAERWVEEQITAVNRFPRARARWVRGAKGPEKATLLREADVFVLPSRYPVEAQPVALLEAMASGCAIVTTRAGEIPTILDETCALILDVPSADAVEGALQSLVFDPGKRSRLARAAHGRFVERYGIERHMDLWESILLTPKGTKGQP
jgi:glycosyltransferase involved in cell wall biosynthesis